MLIRNSLRASGLMLLLLTTLLGCGSSDEQLVRTLEEQVRENRRQTERLVDLQAEVAEGAAQLVEADAQARRDWTTLHADLETQRLELGRQRDLLEDDRRQIAKQRRTESLLAALLPQIGLLVACLLPLVICWMLLRRSDADDGAEIVCSVLLDDLSAERPRLLAPPGRHLESS